MKKGTNQKEKVRQEKARQAGGPGPAKGKAKRRRNKTKSARPILEKQENQAGPDASFGRHAKSGRSRRASNLTAQSLNP